MRWVSGISQTFLYNFIIIFLIQTVFQSCQERDDATLRCEEDYEDRDVGSSMERIAHWSKENGWEEFGDPFFESYANNDVAHRR